MNETKIHIDIDVYYSNPYIPMNMIDREKTDPFLLPDGTYSESVLSKFNLFITRAGLWQKNYEFSDVHIKRINNEQASTQKNFIITGKNKSGTKDVEVLITPRLSDRSYSRNEGHYYSEGKGYIAYRYIELADIIYKCAAFDELAVCRSYDEVIRDWYRNSLMRINNL